MQNPFKPPAANLTSEQDVEANYLRMRSPVSLKTFRFLVIVTVLLSLSGFFYDFVISNPAIEYLHRMEKNVSQTSVVLGGIGAIGGLLGYALQIISLIGLYVLKRWARPLAILGFALYSFATPIFEIDISSGTANALANLSTTLFGALIAIAYFSPLRKAFIPPRS